MGNSLCGFDILGFAVEQPGDRVTARRKKTPGVEIVSIRGDGGLLPKEVQANTAGRAVAALLAERGVEKTFGVELELEKGLPLGSGLGSSAASAAAGVMAADALFADPSPRDRLLRCAVKGEWAASKAVHLDNVAPALFGGMVLCRGEEKIDFLPVPPGLSCSIVHPAVRINTREARGILPSTLRLETAKVQMGRVAAFVTGLFRNDFEAVAGALEDGIAEPFRKHLVPGFDKIRAAAQKAGALGCGFSGSGPAVIAICRHRTSAEEVAQAMEEVVKAGPGLDGDPIISAVGAPGARLLTKEEK